MTTYYTKLKYVKIQNNCLKLTDLIYKYLPIPYSLDN